jgi:hypothetical protein
MRRHHDGTDQTTRVLGFLLHLRRNLERWDQSSIEADLFLSNRRDQAHLHCQVVILNMAALAPLLLLAAAPVAVLAQEVATSVPGLDCT